MLISGACGVAYQELRQQHVLQVEENQWLEVPMHGAPAGGFTSGSVVACGFSLVSFGGMPHDDQEEGRSNDLYFWDSCMCVLPFVLCGAMLCCVRA